MVNEGYRDRSHRSTQLARSRVRSAWLFLIPALIALAAVGLWPLARTLWFSLTDAHLGSAEGARFLGLDNYLLLAGDAEWWNAVRNTVVFAACSVFSRDDPWPDVCLGPECGIPRTRAGSSGGPRAVGDPYGRIGKDVGLDVP